MRGSCDQSRRGIAAWVNPGKLAQRRVGGRDACMATAGVLQWAAKLRRRRRVVGARGSATQRDGSGRVGDDGLSGRDRVGCRGQLHRPSRAGGRSQRLRRTDRHRRERAEGRLPLLRPRRRRALPARLPRLLDARAPRIRRREAPDRARGEPPLRPRLRGRSRAAGRAATRDGAQRLLDPPTGREEDQREEELGSRDERHGRPRHRDRPLRRRRRARRLPHRLLPAARRRRSTTTASTHPSRATATCTNGCSNGWS